MGKNTTKPLRPARTPPPPAAAPTTSTAKWVMWAAIGAIALVALVVAIVSVGGGDEAPATEGTVASVPDVSGGPAEASSPAEMQPVTVIGESLPTLQSGADDPAVGQPAPTLQGYSFDGSPVTIKPGSGGPMLVVVFAHWCPHCNKELPVLAEWRDQGMVPDGLQVVGISTDAEANAPHYPPSEWVVEMDWTWPVLADDAQQDAALAFGVSGYPFFTVIGEDGTVKARGSGEMSLEEFDQLVRSALED